MLSGGYVQTPKKRCVEEAPEVSTKEISGVFTGYDAEIGHATRLLLDTAGRNAPALQPANLDTGDLKERTSAMRAKERLIDDIMITEIAADTVLYVVTSS